MDATPVKSSDEDLFGPNDAHGQIEVPRALFDELKPWCDCAKCTNAFALGCGCCCGCIQYVDECADETTPTVKINRSKWDRCIARRAAGIKPYHPPNWIKNSMCNIL